MVQIYRSFNLILYSQKLTIRILRYLLICLIAIAIAISIGLSIQPLFPPYVFQKDFLQEYLIAKAVLAGINPYLPLPKLASRFLGSLPVAVAPHPTPHPPPVIFISLAYGLIPYEQAAILWLLFEFLCIILSIYLLLNWFGIRSTFRNLGVIFMLFFLWAPLKDEYSVGQLMSLLLLLLISAWLLLRVRKEVFGGILLGFVIAIKLFAWPIGIYLVLQRYWRAVAAAATVVIITNLAAGAVIGFQQVIGYYIKVAGEVTPYYLTFDRNFSIWTLGYRLFQGTYPQLTLGINAPPLISLPGLAPIASIVFAIVFLIAGLAIALLSDNFDAAFVILVCVSILVNPVAWSHYLILTIMPAATVIRYIWLKRLTIREIFNSIAILLFLFIAGGLRSLIFLFYDSDPNRVRSLSVSFPMSLFTLAPLLSIVGLIWLIWRYDRLSLDSNQIVKKAAWQIDESN